MLSSWCVAPMALGDPTSRMRQLRVLKGRCKIVWGRSFPGPLQVRAARFLLSFFCSILLQSNQCIHIGYKGFLHLDALRWAGGTSGQPRLILCSRNLPGAELRRPFMHLRSQTNQICPATNLWNLWNPMSSWPHFDLEQYTSPRHRKTARLKTYWKDIHENCRKVWMVWVVRNPRFR